MATLLDEKEYFTRFDVDVAVFIVQLLFFDHTAYYIFVWCLSYNL